MLTIPNDSNPLILKVISPIPASRMHHLPSKVFEAGDVWFSREIQLPNSRYEKIRGQGIGACELVVFVA